MTTKILIWQSYGNIDVYDISNKDNYIAVLLEALEILIRDDPPTEIYEDIRTIIKKENVNTVTLDKTVCILAEYGYDTDDFEKFYVSTLIQ